MFCNVVRSCTSDYLYVLLAHLILPVFNSSDTVDALMQSTLIDRGALSMGSVDNLADGLLGGGETEFSIRKPRYLCFVRCFEYCIGIWYMYIDVVVVCRLICCWFFVFVFFVCTYIHVHVYVPLLYLEKLDFHF